MDFFAPFFVGIFVGMLLLTLILRIQGGDPRSDENENWWKTGEKPYGEPW